MDSPKTRAVVVVHRGDVELIRWSVALDERDDLDVIDELAHVALAARRCDADLVVEVRCPRLGAIIDLVGLRAALAARGP